MTWSYSGDPSTSEKDAVRFEIGDVDVNDQLVSDEEIQYLLTTEDSIVGAAALCCDKIAARFARDVDKKIEGTSVSASQRYEHYRSLAQHLRSRLTRSGTPYSGNLHAADGESDKANSSLKQPSFCLGMMDYE